MDYEAPLFTAGGGVPSESDFLIETQYLAAGDPPFATIEDVLRHCGIDRSVLYFRNGIAVGATLDADQVAAVRHDSQVRFVERDCSNRVARYFRNLGPSRIEGHYIVSCADGTDLPALLNRHAVASPRIFDAVDSFAAELTDAQRDLLRHDAEVDFVQDDAWESAQ